MLGEAINSLVLGRGLLFGSMAFSCKQGPGRFGEHAWVIRPWQLEETPASELYTWRQISHHQPPGNQVTVVGHYHHHRYRPSWISVSCGAGPGTIQWLQILQEPAPGHPLSLSLAIIRIGEQAEAHFVYTPQRHCMQTPSSYLSTIRLWKGNTLSFISCRHCTAIPLGPCWANWRLNYKNFTTFSPPPHLKDSIHNICAH